MSPLSSCTLSTSEITPNRKAPTMSEFILLLSDLAYALYENSGIVVPVLLDIAESLI